jgi:hypothetical protein
MNSIASEILLFEIDGRLYAQATTNANNRQCLVRLEELGVLPLVEIVRPYERDRASGGNGIEIKFREKITRSDVREMMTKL